MAEHDVGDLVRISAEFTNNETGATLDPDVVKLSYKAPAGTLTTLTYGIDAALVRDDTGHYHADISASTAGLWRYRWFSTGNGQAAEESNFFVRATLTA